LSSELLIFRDTLQFWVFRVDFRQRFFY